MTPVGFGAWIESRFEATAAKGAKDEPKREDRAIEERGPREPCRTRCASTA